MGVVAIVVDGVWTPVGDPTQSVNQRLDTHDVIDAPMSDVDRIVSLLGQVVRLARGLTESDARRVRDFVHATSSMLTATTYLPEQDQARFERALRERGEAG